MKKIFDNTKKNNDIRKISMRRFFMRKKIFIIFLVLIFPLFAYAQEEPEVFVQIGHRGDVRSVAFSPDGRFIVSGSYDRTLKLWDVKTGE